MRPAADIIENIGNLEAVGAYGPKWIESLVCGLNSIWSAVRLFDITMNPIPAPGVGEISIGT